MGDVVAAGVRFSVTDYENNPAAFSAPLSRAKVAPGFAFCQCANPPPRLVIRRKKLRQGDRYILATWPMKGDDHSPSCRFYSSETDDGGHGDADRLRAIIHTEDGFSINAGFSMRRLTGDARTDPENVRLETRHQASRRQRSTLGLLGTLYYLWEAAGLNRCSPHSPRTWPEVYSRLNNVLMQGCLGKSDLMDVMYLVPPFQTDLKFEIDQTWQGFLATRKRTEKTIPLFLVLGEVKSVGESQYSVLTTLRHHKEPIYMDKALAQAVAGRYPSEEAMIANGSQDGRVMGLFVIERTAKGYCYVQNMALMLCSRAYVPCDSAYEVRLANMLTERGRSFEKPMFTDASLGMLPDFVDHTRADPVYLEVWGMDTPTYLTRKREKIREYAAKGLALWQWDALQDAVIPPLP